jgi:hypothetical protein
MGQTREKMKKMACVLAFMMFFSWAAVIFAGGFKVYPGANLDDICEAGQAEAGGNWW